MTALLIVWLAVFAFTLAMGLIIDLQPRWLSLQRLVNWPFKEMPATNAVIFIGILVAGLITFVLVVGPKGFGWI